MVESIVLKELIDFENEKIDFKQGLIVFTGPSGAGKSVLMSAILGSFGFSVQNYASMCEISLSKPSDMDSDSILLEDELYVKTIKKDKVRFLINDQNISKKSLEDIFNPYIKYLSVRDKGILDSQTLLDLVDDFIVSKDESYKKKLDDFAFKFNELKSAQKELNLIIEKETKINDLIEFAKFEIQKIDSISPKLNEYEDLLEIKQKLSKIDKIKESMKAIENIFDYESKIAEFYRLLDVDGSGVSDMFNNIRIDLDDAMSKNVELEDMDIEAVLNRIESLSSLKNRYGSIEEALVFRDKKKEELESFNHIIEDKSKLENFIKEYASILDKLSNDMSSIRKNEFDNILKILNPLLKDLKLPKASFEISKTSMYERGVDEIDIKLGGSKTSTLSGGEFNRLRLALLVSSTINDEGNSKGVLIFDEIDANVSGDESIAIANMLLKLSKNYQIFAISHQPHLASKANQHILITKDENKSKTIVLDDNGRVEEIARIISGERKTQEAIDFAMKLLS
ncbi:MAG: AAA family ATPase [Sulfurovaceae bacterium]|nr:AAA family ATPase [Sulfurovaceae bacterium]MDD5548574.1 AAA family ATPase [Sulfurovaceae bacterium]